MVKAIIFDFDGVILESAGVKTAAFCRLFQDYPDDQIEVIKQYHLDNGGISRVVKIQHAFENILNEPLSDEKLEQLCDRFRELVVGKVIDSDFVPGAEAVLEFCLGKFDMFVASGTPQVEMREIAKKRGMDKYFKDVFGSPTTKTEIVDHILSENNLKPEELIFIGDSRNDLEAAKARGIYFIARYYEGEDARWANDPAVSAKFKDMTEVISSLETILYEKNAS